jgi:hypothetical protein
MLSPVARKAGSLTTGQIQGTSSSNPMPTVAMTIMQQGRRGFSRPPTQSGAISASQLGAQYCEVPGSRTVADEEAARKRKKRTSCLQLRSIGGLIDCCYLLQLWI